jgi:hypothetical protein
MRNACAGRHDVHSARPQDGLAAKTVVVQYFAVKQPRHGLQADVRMRRHVHGFAFGKRQWTEAIEKTPWPDETSISDRQRSGNREMSQIQVLVRIGFEFGS